MAVMVVGEVLIFTAGGLWLGVAIGLEKAFAVGLTPFIAAEIFKMALAAVTVPLVWRAIRH